MISPIRYIYLAKCSTFGYGFAKYRVLIGRYREVGYLREALENDESDFIVVTGRRRVGKTYMIRETYNSEINFEYTGIQDGTLDEQLSNFTYAINHYFPDSLDRIEKPKTWVDAFILLIGKLSEVDSSEKVVVFIDELPWLDTPRSGFIKGLSFFWNSWAVKNNIVLVTCGSAASWMMQKIILNKGGLHNRVSRAIELAPFTLSETREYLESLGLVLNNYQIVQLYMVLGGIPFYLKLIPRGCSVPQIVSALLFESGAPLRNEYENLYRSLFTNHENYTAIIEACYTKWQGITHSEIVKLTGLPSGGSLTRMISELEVSGFIYKQAPIGNKKKDTLYRLVDEFSVFYLKFVRAVGKPTWQAISKSQGYKSWQGFAFENICFKHIFAIKKKLGISGVNSRTYGYRDSNSQIDLIVDRDDQIMNICEAKFYNKEFTITKDYAAKLNRKMTSLNKVVTRNQSVHLTLISTMGLKKNKYSPMVQSEIEMDDLFATHQ